MLRILRLVFLSLIFLFFTSETVLAACTYYFTWRCPDCAKIGARTSGTEGPYSSLGQCNSARSKAQAGVTASGCTKRGSCGVTNPTGSGNTDAAKAEAERKRQEEAARLKQQQEGVERQRKFNQDKNEALGQLKGSSGGGMGLKGGTSSSTPSLKGPGTTSSTPRLKDPTFSRGSQTSAPVDFASDGIFFSDTQGPVCPVGMVLTSLVNGRPGCGRVNPSAGQFKQDFTNALNSNQSYVAGVYQSFRMKEPPGPAIENFRNLKPGDIILVGPKETGFISVAIANAQGKFEEVLGNQPAVTHALIYIGEQSGRKLFLDNQGFSVSSPRGPVIISELEFKHRYGNRSLYNSRPVKAVSDQIDGKKLWRAAHDYARSNLAAVNSANPLRPTDYGVFGDDNVICSESSMFALIKSTGGKAKLYEMINIVPETRTEWAVRQFIDVMPGDIYDAQHNGYFTMKALVIDEKDMPGS